MENQKSAIKELLKNRILWRVYLIWFLRRIVPIMALQVALFALAIRLFANNVFVSSIFKNVSYVAGAGYWAVLKYLGLAFLNTHPLTQLSILAILGIISLLLRDIGRILLTYKAMHLRDRF